MVQFTNEGGLPSAECLVASQPSFTDGVFREAPIHAMFDDRTAVDEDDTVPRPQRSPSPVKALESGPKYVTLASLSDIVDPPANTNPEPKIALTPDGSTRVEWATWRRAYTLDTEVSPKRAAYLYAMVTFVQKELARLGIRCYAEGGSLLGQARDGGIIRYDDDIDLQVHYEDSKKFLAAADELRERVQAWGRAIGEAADLIWVRWGYKVVLIPSDPELQVLRRSPSLEYWYPEDVVVDLFLMDSLTDVDGVERIQYSDLRLREMLRLRGDGHIATARLGNLPRKPFGPTFVHVPEDTREASKDVFGPRCFDQVVCKDGRSSRHHGGSLAVPMDEASLILFRRLLAATERMFPDKRIHG